MKHILIVFLALVQVASAQTFTPIPNNWDGASANGIATYRDSIHIVYGSGQFLKSPAPKNGCILKNGIAEPLPWELPYNTTAIVTTDHDEMYIASTLGIFVLYDDSVTEILRNTSATYALCYYDNSLYFGGTYGFIGNTEGNLARYNLLTGEVTVLSVPGTIKSIAAYPNSSGDTVLYALSSERGHGLQKFSLDLTSLSMTDEESNPAAYSGRSMIVWNNKLVIACLEPGYSGYIGWYDGHEWEFSHNLVSPEALHVSQKGELYATGALFENDSIYAIARVFTPNEITELCDAEYRRVIPSYFGQEVFLAWDTDRTYVVLNEGAWVDGYTDNMHMFRIDSETGVRPESVIAFPNPTSGELYIDFPTRVLDILYIYTIDGRKVHEEITWGLHTKLDVNALQNGIYIVTCGKYRTKIIIAH